MANGVPLSEIEENLDSEENRPITGDGPHLDRYPAHEPLVDPLDCLADIIGHSIADVELRRRAEMALVLAATTRSLLIKHSDLLLAERIATHNRTTSRLSVLADTLRAAADLLTDLLTQPEGETNEPA